MSGGFTPGLKRYTDPLSGQINILASQHMMVKSVGITLDASLVDADEDGNKVVANGTVVAKVTDTGKYGPYDAEATDGREDVTSAGIIFNGGVNLRDGDTVTGILMHGSVLKARIPNLDAAAETALQGRIIFQ